MRVRIRRFDKRQDFYLSFKPLVVVDAGDCLALKENPSGFTTFAFLPDPPSGGSLPSMLVPRIFHVDSFTVQPFAL